MIRKAESARGENILATWGNLRIMNLNNKGESSIYKLQKLGIFAAENNTGFLRL